MTEQAALYVVKQPEADEELHPMDKLATVLDIIERLKGIEQELKALGLGDYGSLKTLIGQLGQAPERLAQPFKGEVIKPGPEPRPPLRSIFNDPAALEALRVAPFFGGHLDTEMFERRVSRANIERFQRRAKHELGINDEEIIYTILHWLLEQASHNPGSLYGIELDILWWHYGQHSYRTDMPYHWTLWRNRPQCRMADEIMASRPPNITQFSRREQKILFWAFGKTWARTVMSNAETIVMEDPMLRPSWMGRRMSLYDHLCEWAAEHYTENTYRFGPDNC